MKLSQLYYFKRLAELQHYTQAALELNITQPSLSGAIHSLEEELGVDLFKKKGRNIILTDNGKEFYIYVSNALRELDKGKDIMQERANKLMGKIELGSINALLSEFLPNAMKKFRNQAGEKVTVVEHNRQTHEILESIQSGKWEIGFCSYDEGFPDLKFVPVLKQYFCIACTRDHPLSSRKKVSIRELEEYDIFSYRLDMPVGREVRNLLKDRDITIDYNYSSEEALVGVLKSTGRPALLLNAPFVTNDSHVHLIELEDIPNNYHLVYMVYNKKIQRAHVVDSFIKFIESEYKPDI